VAGRSILQRVVTYWTVITLGPLLLLVSLYVAGQIVEWARPIPVVGSLLVFAGRFTALGASWILLLVLYTLMPNTNVAVKPAVIGSFVGAVLWEIGKWGFGLYVSRALPYSALYGSLGLIPLFLFWVYITWVVVLFG